MKKPAYSGRFKRSAQGFVLLLIVLSMLAIGAVVFLNGLGGALVGSRRGQAQAQASNDVLIVAKAALLGYVAQKIDGGSGYRLGNLPTPDILNAAGTAIYYDGIGDGISTNKCLSTGTNGLPGVSPGTSSRSSTQRCLGKFPWRDFNLDVGNPDANDPIGQVPWLAISANLNYWDNCLATLNSDTVSWMVSSGTSCPATANTLAYPWLTVVDQNGVVHNNVAAVLIMPGPPIQTGSRSQSRTVASPGYPADYLDDISLPLGCVTTCTPYDNAGLTNTFVQIPAGTRYPSSAENASLAGQPVAFNDVLIYITIDELLLYIERRVLAEMKSSIVNFYNTTGIGKYPWVAPFSSPSGISAFKSTPTNTVGLFPFTVVPGSGASVPAVSSDFDWSISGASLSKKCVNIGSNRYVDTREFLLSLYSTGTAPGTSPTCTWQTNGPLAVTCDYTTLSPASVPSTFRRYTGSTCSTLNGSTSTRVIVPTQIKVTIDATCNSTPVVTYAAATATDFSRWSWQCSSVKSTTAFKVDVNYSLYTTGGVPVSGTTDSVTISGANKSVSANRMRYQPLMPYWFYSNEWYLTAFAAVAPANAPSTVTPCGSASKLTVGANTNVAVLAYLAGKNLTGNARPSGTLSDYLEGINLTGSTNCAFEDTSKSVTTTYNDQMIVVSP